MSSSAATSVPQTSPRTERKIKCVIWDLDNTLWDGVLLEDPTVHLKPCAAEILKTLDSRGILQSIASKNDEEVATSCLAGLGVLEYFVVPQINWNSKAHSVRRIAEALNIGLDSVAFIDDEQYELTEVSAAAPETMCLHASSLDSLLSMAEMNPAFITEDSRQRRLRYQAENSRKLAEQEFHGPTEEFLASLGMAMTVSPVEPGDLERAEELTLRTNQLNTTGYTYSVEELAQFSVSPGHLLLIAELEDRFGSYGKIGLTLVEKSAGCWCIKLLLMSCRVLSRGIGTIMIRYIMNLAAKAGVRLLAEFVPNDRNRMMFMTYRLMGFKELEHRKDLVILEGRIEGPQGYPEFVKMNISDLRERP